MPALNTSPAPTVSTTLGGMKAGQWWCCPSASKAQAPAYPQAQIISALLPWLRRYDSSAGASLKPLAWA